MHPLEQKAIEIATGLRAEMERTWDSPAGLCGLASVRLCRKLRSAGIQATVVNGSVDADMDLDVAEMEPHFWVRVDVADEPLFIDITGDQFLLSGREIEPVHAFYYDPAYRIDERRRLNATAPGRLG